MRTIATPSATNAARGAKTYTTGKSARIRIARPTKHLGVVDDRTIGIAGGEV
jgi:hypothetical protein